MNNRSNYSASSESFDDFLTDVFGFNPFNGFEVLPTTFKTIRNTLPQCFVSSDNPRNNLYLYDNGTMKIEVSLEGLGKDDIKTWFNKRENRFYVGLKESEKPAETTEENKDEEKSDSKEVAVKEEKEEPKVVQLKRGFSEAKAALKNPLWFFIDPEKFDGKPTSIKMENGKLTVEFGPVDKSEDEEIIKIL